MIAQVYHLKQGVIDAPFICLTPKEWPKFPEDYEHVATVKGDDKHPEDVLEWAFQQTNHIDQPWQNNTDGVIWFRSHNERSTSVGDIALIDGMPWLCKAIGWEPFIPFI